MSKINTLKKILINLDKDISSDKLQEPDYIYKIYNKKVNEDLLCFINTDQTPSELLKELIQSKELRRQLYKFLIDLEKLCDTFNCNEDELSKSEGEETCSISERTDVEVQAGSPPITHHSDTKRSSRRRSTNVDNGQGGFSFGL